MHALDLVFPEVEEVAAPQAPVKRTSALRVALVSDKESAAFPWARHLAEDLHRLGHQVQWLRPRNHRWETPGEGLMEVLLPAHPSPARLVHHWRRYPPDVVHVLGNGYLGWAATHTARQMGLPVTFAADAQLIHQPRAGDRWQQRLAQGWKRHICRSADAVLAPTFVEVQQLRKQGLHHLRVAAQGVDLQLWNPQQRSHSLRRQWGVRTGTQVMAHLGPVDNADTVAGLRAAMDALLALDADARLLLIDAGRIPARLQALRPLRGEDWHDRPLGQRNADRKPTLATLLASADILLMPAPEARPELIPHGLACGLALVARCSDLSLTYLEDGHNGILVGDAQNTATTPGAYGEAINRLLSRPTDLTRLRLRAPASIAHLERSHTADQLARILKEVAQGHARRLRAANTLVIATD